MADSPSVHAREWLSVADLAAWLGVPERTVRAWRHRGSGPPSVRLGRHVRFRRVDVEQWITEHYAAEERARG